VKLQPLRLVSCALTALFVSASAHAADHTLTISSWAPPTHGINAQMWPNLIKMMEEATDGAVTAECLKGRMMQCSRGVARGESRGSTMTSARLLQMPR
jgi:TRAP-type C4-dicarboxylate transport system substrate-binding protein